MPTSLKEGTQALTVHPEQFPVTVCQETHYVYGTKTRRPTASFAVPCICVFLSMFMFSLTVSGNEGSRGITAVRLRGRCLPESRGITVLDGDGFVIFMFPGIVIL